MRTYSDIQTIRIQESPLFAIYLVNWLQENNFFWLAPAAMPTTKLRRAICREPKPVHTWRYPPESDTGRGLVMPLLHELVSDVVE